MPQAGAEHGAGVGDLQDLQDGGVGLRTERGLQPTPDLPADAGPHLHHVGPVAEQRGRTGADRRAVHGGEPHGATGLGHPLGEGLAQVDQVGRRLHPPPQGFGQQMVLAGEIGVRRGRSHPRPFGDAAHRDLGVAPLLHLLHGGRHQAFDGLGLALGEVAPSRLVRTGTGVAAVGGIATGPQQAGVRTSESASNT